MEVSGIILAFLFDIENFLRKCSKVILNKELANTILTRSYDFIIHEKSLLKDNFMGEKINVKISF